MTSPAPLDLQPVDVEGDDVAVWRLDGCTFRGDGMPDELGRQWIVETVEGWSAPAKRRNRRDSRPDGIGSYRGTSYSDERIVTLSGHVTTASAGDREAVETQLAAICGDERELYQLRRTTRAFDQTLSVEVDEDPLVEALSWLTVKFSLQLAAPDPRKHDAAWQEPYARPATNTDDGLDYTDGLDYSGGGLDYGVAALGFPAQVSNDGTADTGPFFTLRGPLAAPSIFCVETGLTLTYGATIASGETVWINADEFPTRGVPAQSCVSSIRGETSALLTVGVRWPVVEPGTSASYQLLATGTDTSLAAALRSAWK